MQTRSALDWATKSSKVTGWGLESMRATATTLQPEKASRRPRQSMRKID